MTISSSPANAAILLSTGTYVAYYDKVQTDTSGSKQNFTLIPYLGAGPQFQLSSRFYFVPELGLVYYTNAPEGVFKNQVMLNYNFSFILSNIFILRGGLTTHWLQYHGKGGTQKLKNGSSTAEFNNPNESHTSYFTTLNFGAELFFQKDNSIRSDIQAMSITEKSSTRAYNYILSYNVYF